MLKSVYHEVKKCAAIFWQKGAAAESLTFWVGIDLEGVDGSQNMLQRADLQEGERAGCEADARRGGHS